MDAPLAARLQAFADDVASLAPDFAEIVERMISALRMAEVGRSAPLRGEPMPPFMLPDQDSRLVVLDRLLAGGPVVLSFHRGGWCPYCRINADALARLAPEVAARGARVVAITPDLAQFNAELRADAKADFPILTDLDNGYALEVNVAFKVPEEKRIAMTAAGWDISRSQASDAWILPIPATFVIDRNGMILERFIDPDYRKRATHEAILAALPTP
ncbi:MAG: peroxiredoxin-like family protein [Hyphomicrobiaceae bacterium]